MLCPATITDNTFPIDIISFKQLRSWKYPMCRGVLEYDYISDDEILSAMLSLDIDIDIRWEDDIVHHNKFVTTLIEFHASRISALVKHIVRGGLIYPVGLDTESCDCSCVVDGHHRLRALEFLGYTHFPVYCSGYLDIIESLTSIGD